MADEYLKVAEEDFQKIPQGLDHVRNELRLGIAKAKVKIYQK